MAYEHGIMIEERETSLTMPVNGTAGLQVVFGTAPVNLLSDPSAACNVPIMVSNFSEASEQLGYSDNYEKFTLCQSMDASFKIQSVSPVIFVNVLDPQKHKKTGTAVVQALNNQALIEEEGVLRDSVKIKKDADELKVEEDYILSFDTSGNLLITFIGIENAVDLSVEYETLAPEMVTEMDLIGGYDTSTGIETGLELLRQIYPKFNVVPGLVVAPGWSHKPAIGAVMAMKCKSVNNLFSCMAILDLDTEIATKYTECEEVKENMGYNSPYSAVTWPKLLIGGKQYYYSAILAAKTAEIDANNDDVPSLSPSNKLVRVQAAVLESGEEVMLDQQQANVLNGTGIVTALNFGGWRTWGNNTACYPENRDPKDRWISCRRFFSWYGNNFILNYFDKVDDPLNYRLIEAIVDAENIRGNSLVASGKCAGAKIEFNKDDNPNEDILDGKIKFAIYLTPYPPAEKINATLEFDPTALEAELSGGE